MNERYRILAYDATPKKKFGVEWTWGLGARVFGPWFDQVVACRSWDQLLQAVVKASHEQDKEIEVHFWGHGWYGRALIDGKPCPATDPRWSAVHTIWFRTCMTAGGEDGAAFLYRLARQGCRVAAHTVVIGAHLGAQSHLYGLDAGQMPWWPKTPDGAPEVTGATQTAPMSSPFAPRTVMFWQQDLPEWAFTRQNQLEG